MFVMAAINRRCASSVDENLCVIERLNNGKTQANISSQKQNKITSYMRHTRPNEPCYSYSHGRTKLYFSADRGPNLRGHILGVKFMFLSTKLTLILTVNNS